MPKLVVLIGPPGSGKSTRSHEQYRDFVRVNRDEQGKDGQMVQFTTAVVANRDIVIDKMNFNEQQRKMFTEEARRHGYSIHYHILFVPRERCLARMRARFGSHPTVNDEAGAQAALQTFFTKFEYPVLQEGDTIQRDYGDRLALTSFPVVLCDLDGTLCNIDHRLHHVRGEDKKKRRWDRFFAEIPGDSINAEVDALLSGMKFQSYPIAFVSGRGEETRTDTKEWLVRNSRNGHSPLYMRPAKDSRPDYLIKEILLDFEILTRYSKVLFVLDDRDSVVQMWRRRGIRCLQVAPGDF